MAPFNLPVGVISEVSQLYRPRGVFGGRFDLCDIAAYGAGLSAACAFDKQDDGSRS